MASIRCDTTKTGLKRYRVRVRLRGARKSGTFIRKAEAMRFAVREEKRILLDALSPVAQAGERTVAEMIERYGFDILAHKGRQTRIVQEAQLGVWRELIGHLVLAEVTPDVIADCRAVLVSRGLSPATVNRYLSAISHCFAWAVRERRWCVVNPVREVYRLPEPTGRDRHLSEAELKRLLMMCKVSVNRLLYTVVVVALSTGARKDEARRLKWRNVDLERGLFYVLSKNGERQKKALCGEALELMRSLYAERDPAVEFCFPSETDERRPMDFRRAWETAVRRARLHDFHYHDLRHSAASFLAAQGATLQEIGEILGHKSLRSTMRYTHLTQQHTRGVVARMNERYLPARRLNG